MVLEALLVGGWVYEEPKAYPVIPTYHPAAVMHGDTNAESAILATLQIVRALIRGEKLIPADKYLQCSTLEEVQAAYDEIRAAYRSGETTFIAWDLEHDGVDVERRERAGLNPWSPHSKILSWSISYKPEQAFFIPFRHDESPFRADGLQLQAIINLTQELFNEIPVSNHNLAYDAIVAQAREGLVVRRIHFDTLLAARWIWADTGQNSLEALASRHCQMLAHKGEMERAIEESSYKLQVPTGRKRKDGTPCVKTVTIPGSMASVDLDLLRRYNGADTDAAYRLTNFLMDKIAEDSRDPSQCMGGLHCLRAASIDLIDSAVEMTLNGMQADVPSIQAAIDTFADQIEALKQWFADKGYAEQVQGIRARLEAVKPLDDRLPPDKQAVDAEKRIAKARAKAFNPGSGDDKAWLIHDVLQTPRKYRTAPSKRFPQGKDSTAAENLENYKLEWTNRGIIGIASHPFRNARDNKSSVSYFPSTFIHNRSEVVLVKLP